MSELRIVPSSELSDAELQELRRALETAFEDGFTAEDWEHTIGGIHVIAGGGPIFSHAALVERVLMAGDREIRTGYVESVATHPDRRDEGHGSRVMSAVNGLIEARYEMGALSTGIPGFYSRLGWEPWTGPTYVRSPGGLLRTEDDDDSIMILRTSRSGPLDLTGSLSCDWRAGDVW